MRAHACDDVTRDIGEVDRFALEPELRRFGGGERLDVLNDPREPKHLLVQRAQPLGRRLLDPVDQLLELTLGDRERGSQLVRDIGGERPPQRVLTLDRLRHPVKGARELTQLRRLTRTPRSRRAITRGDRPRRSGEPAQRQRDPPRDEQSDHGSERRGEHAAPQDRLPERAADLLLRRRRCQREPQHRRPDPLAAGGHRNLTRGAQRPCVRGAESGHPHHPTDTRAEAARAGDRRARGVADLKRGAARRREHPCGMHVGLLPGTRSGVGITQRGGDVARGGVVAGLHQHRHLVARLNPRHGAEDPDGEQRDQRERNREPPTHRA